MCPHLQGVEMGSWLDEVPRQTMHSRPEVAPPFVGKEEKQEQSLAGGTAGLRTWVHLT